LIKQPKRFRQKPKKEEEMDDMDRMLRELILAVQHLYPGETLKIGDYSDEDLIYYNKAASCGYRYIEACDPPRKILGIPIPFSEEKRLIFAIAKPYDNRAEVFDLRIKSFAQKAIESYNQETGRRVVLTRGLIQSGGW